MTSLATRRALEESLTSAIESGASDIHLGGGHSPSIRVAGTLRRAPELPAAAIPIPDLVAAVLPQSLQERFAGQHAADFSFSIEGVGRFRANAYQSLGGPCLAIRTLPEVIPDLAALRLPNSLHELVDHPDGLVLFTGPTSCGKSATMAALIDWLLRERSLHIITLEDPIEFVHSGHKGIVRQRELGAHVASFAGGLRDALREDPDVILVGEMRDLDTISLALTAAETGHLVLSTLHTGRAPRACERIVDAFDGTQQGQIRLQLADSLRAVVAQRLLPTQSGEGRIPAVEVLRVNHAVANHIRDGRTHQLPSVMQTHRDAGMWPMERHLAALVRKGLIAEDLARVHSEDVGLLETFLAG